MTKRSATLRQPRHSMPQLERLHLNNITYNCIKRIAVSECMGSKGQDRAGGGFEPAIPCPERFRTQTIIVNDDLPRQVLHSEL